MGIAPLFGVAGVALPLSGNPHATREGDAPVADQQFAVGAFVVCPKAESPERAKPDDLCAGIPHQPHQFGVHLGGADRIEQHAHTDPATGRPGERMGEAARDSARPIDEGQKFDGLGGPLDGLQHRRENLHAIAQYLDAVA